MIATGGETGMDAAARGRRDYLDGLSVTRCPFPNGKQRRAWVAAWYAARAEA